jgi:hypothetical protein
MASKGELISSFAEDEGEATICRRFEGAGGTGRVADKYGQPTRGFTASPARRSSGWVVTAL